MHLPKSKLQYRAFSCTARNGRVCRCDCVYLLIDTISRHGFCRTHTHRQRRRTNNNTFSWDRFRSFNWAATATHTIHSMCLHLNLLFRLSLLFRPFIIWMKRRRRRRRRNYDDDENKWCVCDKKMCVNIFAVLHKSSSLSSSYVVVICSVHVFIGYFVVIFVHKTLRISRKNENRNRFDSCFSLSDVSRLYLSGMRALAPAYSTIYIIRIYYIVSTSTIYYNLIINDKFWLFNARIVLIWTLASDRWQNIQIEHDMYWYLSHPHER